MRGVTGGGKKLCLPNEEFHNLYATQYYWNGRSTGDENVRTCKLYGDKNEYRTLVRNLKDEKTSYTWEDNIKVYLEKGTKM
jgi:hypothetical protein